MEKNQEMKHFEIDAIIKRGKNTNTLTGKEETFFSCSMVEVSTEDKVKGREVYGGATIGKTFLEKREGGWVRLLQRVKDEEDELTIKDLPLFKGFIHECVTKPYYVRIKDENGDWKFQKYQEGHEDAGQRVVANKFKQLLGADEDPDVAVEDFLGRQKLVDMAEVDASAYKQGGKAFSILDLAGKEGDDPESAGDEKKDKK
jgi:hypothetical protein